MWNSGYPYLNPKFKKKRKNSSRCSKAIKANELLEKTKKEIQIFAPDYYLAQLYYTDFTDKLKNKLKKIDITLLVEDSPKSAFFIEQIQWPKHKTSPAS